MRLRFALPALVVLALAAWLAWPRAQVLPDAAPRAADGPRDQAELESEPEVQVPQAEPARASADSLRFEPLPGEPSELVLRFITGEPERTLTGVECWALEMDQYEGYQGHIADVERELSERGRKIECDAQGRAHLPLPARWWLVGARAGELFGAHTFEADDAPADALELFDSRDCSVHTRSSAGRPLGGVPVLVTEKRGVLWQGISDAAGELVIPNLGWLLEDFGGEDRAWFVSAMDASAEPPLVRFEKGAALPRAVELVLGPANALRLQVLASDGTPVAVNGEISLEPCGPEARISAVELGERSTQPLPIRAGLALLPRIQARARLSFYALLDGSQVVSGEMRVPDEPGEHDVPLRLAGEQQVLRFTAFDAQGRALAGRTVEWFTFHGPEDPGPDVDREFLHLDEQSRGALVIERLELLPPDPDPDPDAEPEPLPHVRAVLRMYEAGVLYQTQPLRIEALGTAPVIDLGALRLEPAQPLVRGRVHDESGRGIARVTIELDYLRVDEDGESSDDVYELQPLRTDAEGRFELYGTCAEGRARLSVERFGYVLPEGAKAPEFECGTTPTVDVTLVRTGVLRMSVLVDAPLRELYDWKITGPGGEERELLFPGAAVGERISERWSLTPGSYSVRLAAWDPFAEPIVEVEGVEVRAGEITLDPRILRVPLREPPVERSTPSTAPSHGPVELHIVDESGRPLRGGTFTAWNPDHWSLEEFYAGVVKLRPEQVGQPVGFWAPGRRYRELDCPDHDATVELQPAPRLRLRLEVPPEFARAGVSFQASLDGEECELRSVPDVWSGAELDARGEALFECPKPCTYSLELMAVRVDAAGLFDEGTTLETANPLMFTLADQPGEQLWKPAIRAEEWAALAQSLGLKR